MNLPPVVTPLLDPVPVPDRARWLWDRLVELSQTWNFPQVAWEIWTAYFGLAFITGMIYLVSGAIAWLETRSIIFTGFVLSIEGYIITGLAPEAQYFGVLGMTVGVILVFYRLLRS